MRTEQEIEAMTDKAVEHSHENKWPGMTYEQGVRAALDWVMEYEDDDPTEG